MQLFLTTLTRSLKGMGAFPFRYVVVTLGLVAFGFGQPKPVVEPSPLPPPSDSGWLPLFNGTDFTGLDGSLTDGGDFKNIFKVESGTIHATAPFTYGFVSTVKEYSNYRCRVQFKWAVGVKEGWNAGFLYHSSGKMPAGENWPSSLEFQFKRGDAGSLWIFGGPWVSATQKNNAYAEVSEGGTLREIGGGGYQTIVRRSDAEQDGWNQAELVVHGDTSMYILNGVVTFRGVGIKYRNDNGEKVPLTKGLIRLQSEGAEISYRNFYIQELDPLTGKPVNMKPTGLIAGKHRLTPFIAASSSRFGISMPGREGELPMRYSLSGRKSPPHALFNEVRRQARSSTPRSSQKLESPAGE